MSLANSKSSQAYQDALAATATAWEGTSSGFSDKAETPSIASLSRQLNTILFLTLRIDSNLSDLQNRVQVLDDRVRLVQNAREVYGTRAQIDSLAEQLAGLQINPTTVIKTTGTLKVHRNPFELLRRIR
ncbi:ORF2 [Cycad leaf necrosis virus]|uniref:ORF2 n=1 Tax=Cycad leaf necrosis virus TaxID=549205 RepID=B5AK49_9VIRU|nr:ORF2 [Cycad leaf necrosis virus]ACF60612.1 ORF2 [Cycad leaf necrosis virus]